MKYLDKLNSHQAGGTNILAALEIALTLDPSVIVLITDGLPVAGDGVYIEEDKDIILETVREKNVNNAIIYVVALEIDVKRSPGAKLLFPWLKSTMGK